MYSLSHKVKWKKHFLSFFVLFFYSVIYEKYYMQKLPAKKIIKTHLFQWKHWNEKQNVQCVVPYSSSSYTKGIKSKYSCWNLKYQTSGADQ